MGKNVTGTPSTHDRDRRKGEPSPSPVVFMRNCKPTRSPSADLSQHPLARAGLQQRFRQPVSEEGSPGITLLVASAGRSGEGEGETGGPWCHFTRLEPGDDGKPEL